MRPLRISKPSSAHAHAHALAHAHAHAHALALAQLQTGLIPDRPEPKHNSGLGLANKDRLLEDRTKVEIKSRIKIKSRIIKQFKSSPTFCPSRTYRTPSPIGWERAGVRALGVVLLMNSLITEMEPPPFP